MYRVFKNGKLVSYHINPHDALREARNIDGNAAASEYRVSHQNQVLLDGKMLYRVEFFGGKIGYCEEEHINSNFLETDNYWGKVHVNKIYNENRIYAAATSQTEARRVAKEIVLKEQGKALL